MKKILILSSLILFASCGLDIGGLESLENVDVDAEVQTDIPDKINLEPDFENAMRVCDERYGAKTKESEECFEDFRNYYKTSFGLDLSGIIEFCEDRYNLEEEQELCQDELLNIIDQQDLQQTEE
jgi:hypothetical protein